MRKMGYLGVLCMIEMMVTGAIVTLTVQVSWCLKFSLIIMLTNLCLVCKTKAGAPCAFPFLYKRKHHYECITDDNNGTPWCGTGYSALGRPDVFGTRLYYTNETGNCMSDCPGMLVYPKFIIFTEQRS